MPHKIHDGDGDGDGDDDDDDTITSKNILFEWLWPNNFNSSGAEFRIFLEK